MKKDIESILRRKSYISYAYFFLALMFWVTPFESIPFLDPFLNQSPKIAVLIGFVYLLHFLMGAFYYPERYRERIKKEKNQKKENPSGCDLSSFRAMGTALVASLIMYFSFEKYSLVVAIIFFALNIVLAVLTKTSHLFKEDFIED